VAVAIMQGFGGTQPVTVKVADFVSTLVVTVTV
jgi:hypothetical protein